LITYRDESGCGCGCIVIIVIIGILVLAFIGAMHIAGGWT
jgi:hypothetical protein